MPYLASEFDTWHEAHEEAQRRANRYRQSYGIEKPCKDLPKYAQKWTIKMIPRKENRYGWELRCEVVEPFVP